MKKNRILMIFILVGILSSAILLFSRINIESEDKTVDIVLDLDEIEKMARQSDQDLDWWLRKFKELGASSVVLLEENFESLSNSMEPIDIRLMGNLKNDMDLENRYPEEFVNYLKEENISEYDVIINTNSNSLYSFIDNGLKSKYDRTRYRVFTSEDKYTFLLFGTEKDALYHEEKIVLDNNENKYKLKKELLSSKLLKLGIGYDKEKIDLIKDAGLKVVLRPSNNSIDWQNDIKYIESILASYDEFDIKAEYMIFAGDQALGYPHHSEKVLDFMKDNNTKLALIESNVQRGHMKQEATEEYASLLDYNSVRLFSIPPYIQERYKYYKYDGAQEIENTLYRAVTERNIRLIYFRPFKSDSYTYVTDDLEYERTFNSFQSRIADHGMQIGSASTMKTNKVSGILAFLIGLGIFGGGMILISSMFDLTMKFKKLIFILGLIILPIVLYVAPNTSITILSMTAAMVFPSLSMLYCCSKLKNFFLKEDGKSLLKTSIVKGTSILTISSLISLIGAIFIASLLSSTEYLLEIKVFRGVKIVQLVPILIYIIIFIAMFGYRRNKSFSQNKFTITDFNDLMFDNINIIATIGCALMLGIGYIYLARTGHESGIQPSDYEMIVRNFLEVELLARPRTKEFLIAFPAVLMAVYIALNKKKVGVFILGIFIVIGQTSIINTFSHLRTPFYLSITRSVYSLAFGIIAGILYLMVLYGGIKLFKSLEGDIFNE